jgi:ParB/RepB/Spo0J family partition protein
MPTSTSKLVLNGARDIPFNKLVPSAANVRKVKAGVSIEELAEDIGRRGLIQSLHVRPVLDGAGVETGLFEVTAGGRRLQALQRLVKAKRLVKAQGVPCVVQTDHGTAAEEDSLAENVQRAPLHPLDQFRAFRALREERGTSDEEIAAAFFVSVQVVKQRLKLTTVSGPCCMDMAITQPFQGLRRFHQFRKHRHYQWVGVSMHQRPCMGHLVSGPERRCGILLDPSPDSCSSGHDDRRGTCHGAPLIAPQACMRPIPADRDHDAALRISGKVPKRRVHSAQRLDSHAYARRATTSDRHWAPAIAA